MSTRKLKGIFDFSSKDLELNRAGYLSEPQRDKLSVDHKTGRWRAAALVVLFTLPGLYCFFTGLQGLQQDPSAGLAFVMALMFFLAAGAMLYYTFYGPTALREDIDKGEVTSAFGKCTKSVREVYTRYGMRIELYVEIGNVNLGQVSNEVFALFLNEHCYTAYYLPRTQKIVSIEQVDCWNREPLEYKSKPQETPPPPKQRSSLLAEIETAISTQVVEAVLVYKISNGEAYHAEIQWKQKGTQEARVLWQSQSTDKNALYTQGQQRLTQLLQQFGQRGWRIVRESGEGESPSSPLPTQKIYVLERRNENKMSEAP